MKRKETRELKLKLAKETVRALQSERLDEVLGGITGTLCSNCNTRCTCGTRLC